MINCSIVVFKWGRDKWDKCRFASLRWKKTCEGSKVTRQKTHIYRGGHSIQRKEGTKQE